jgi:hypothetical protein
MTTHPLVSDYIAQLSRVTFGLDPTARAELLQEVRQHISDAQAAGDDIPAVLTELGSPEQIAQAAGLRIRTSGRTRAQTAYDLGTVFLLAVGAACLPYIGWFIGVILLWNGPRWTIRDRLIGTLVPPLGASGVLMLGQLTLGLGAVDCSQVGEDIVCRRTLLPGWLGLALPVVYLTLGATAGGYLVYRAARSARGCRWSRSDGTSGAGAS